MQDRRTLIREIDLYLVLVFALSSVSYALILANEGASAGRQYIVALMWTPAVAALLTVAIRRLDLAGLGWGWGR